jgi:hypothetical protein
VSALLERVEGDRSLNTFPPFPLYPTVPASQQVETVYHSRGAGSHPDRGIPLYQRCTPEASTRDGPSRAPGLVGAEARNHRGEGDQGPPRPEDHSPGRPDVTTSRDNGEMEGTTRRYADPNEVALVRWLSLLGLNNSKISRLTGVSRASIRDWRGKPPLWPRYRRNGHETSGSMCPRCHERKTDDRAYVYLLGLYLGDGCLSRQPNGVYKLRISCAARYPALIEECRRAIAVVRGTGRLPGRVHRVGCLEVYAGWNHWPCLFPQHGPGRKHERKIRLAAGQQDLARMHPDALLRGLLHSDGCRVLNRVNGTPYPRYFFTNHSEDIRAIFCWACDI